MKKPLLAVIAVAAVATAVGLSRHETPVSSSGDVKVAVEARNPWTHLRLNNDPDEFRFVIVSDRTGGHRPGVFSRAVDQINLLQPEFVLSVGDLIEGYNENPERVAEQWKEFQTYVHKLQMPFFYVPGNHDLSNKYQEQVWTEKFGRRYYSFNYRNVLFLVLSSEDNPGAEGKQGYVGPEQIDFVKKALADNPSVRWTIVAVHRPLWSQDNVSKTGWLEVEKALAGRNYTVFAGHIHRFRKYVRNGANYYQLSTTGGSSRMRGLDYGEFDQVAWVTMKKDGPVIANVMLDGVFAEDMSRPITDEEGVPNYNRKPAHPVAGQVLLDGCPLPGMTVVFNQPSADGKRYRWFADARIEADGSFVLSSYRAGDGASVGEYAVTVVPSFGLVDTPGRAQANQVPEKYRKAETTPLKAVVKEGKNTFAFELKH
jgi:3',5'-cyclic AMP phosphodiesterase CpdA